MYQLKAPPEALKKASIDPYFAKITWKDTLSSSGWEEVEEINPARVIQWGWVIHEDQEQIKVATTIMDNIWYGITAIPAGCIAEIDKCE